VIDDEVEETIDHTLICPSHRSEMKEALKKSVEREADLVMKK
jgi:hypothetical protein